MGNMGKLIQRARQINTGLTQEQAAKAAGFRSKTYWSQIEEGTRTPPADTAARMSRVVGLTPAQLRKTGNPAAADELAEILNVFGPYIGDGADRELVTRIRALSDEQRKALFVLLKVIPSAAPVAVALGTLFRRRPRSVLLGAAASGTAATAAVALAVWLPWPMDTGQQPGQQPEVIGTPRQRRPAAVAPPRPSPHRERPGATRPGTRPGVGKIRGTSRPVVRTTESHRPAPVLSADPGLPPVVVDPPPKVVVRQTPRCTVRVAVRPVVHLCVRLPLG